LLVAGSDALFERPHQIRVATGHQLVRQLHDADLGAERLVYAGHFEANNATTEHQQPAGHLAQLQRAGGRYGGDSEGG